MSLFSFKKIFNLTQQLLNNFTKKQNSRLKRLEKKITQYIDFGHSIDSSVDKALKEEKYFSSLNNDLKESIGKAAVLGYNVLPEKQKNTTPAEEKILRDMETEKPVQVSSELQRKLSGKIADTTWIADEMKLSDRLHSAKVKEEIISTVKSGLRNAETIKQLAQKLYDGYDSGGILSKAKMPKYLQRLINQASVSLDNNSVKKAELLAIAKSLKASNIDKLQTKDLKIAYQNLLNVCSSSDLKKESLERAIHVAVQEKTRYHAMRIARTELQRSWFEGLLARYEDNELLFGWQWKLSSRHKYVRFDQCDVIANADMGFGKGIYPRNKVPLIPRHPHCGCMVAPVFVTQIDTKKRFRPEKAREYIDGLVDWRKQVLFGIDGAQAYKSGADWQEVLRGWDGFSTAGNKLSKDMFETEIVKSDLDYMSNSFRPEYLKKENVNIFNRTIEVKKVKNSQFNIYADVAATRRNKAVRLVEKIMRGILNSLPKNFTVPDIVVIDFDKYGLNRNAKGERIDAIGGFEKHSGKMFINSKYDTKEKISKFVNKTPGLFANKTYYAPYYHELGHKYYEDCIKSLSERANLSYNRAKDIIDNKIADYVHERNYSGDFLAKNISIYADRGFYNKKMSGENMYTEIIAECFTIPDILVAIGILSLLTDEDDL